MPAKPIAPSDELPTLDTADLARVTGGTGDDLSTMLPLLMLARRNGSAGAAAAPPPAAAVPPWQPTITIDGVPQQLTQSGTGSFTTTG
jgi:hypothetical protein